MCILRITQGYPWAPSDVHISSAVFMDLHSVGLSGPAFGDEVCPSRCGIADAQGLGNLRGSPLRLNFKE